MFSFKDSKIYIHRRIGRPLYIGFVDKKTSTLFIHDTDNYIPENRLIGIDKEILDSPKLDYLYISIKFAQKKYQTTRYYFKVHSIPREIYNGRDLRFMPLYSFDLNKALDYEKSLDEERNSQIDLFDAASAEAKSGIRLLDMYVHNLEKTTEKVIKEEKSKCQETKTSRLLL